MSATIQNLLEIAQNQIDINEKLIQRVTDLERRVDELTSGQTKLGAATGNWSSPPHWGGGPYQYPLLGVKYFGS